MKAFRLLITGCSLTLVLGAFAPTATAASAPDWMRAQTAASLPTYDDKTDAVQLYSETVLVVQPNGSMKQLHRAAYKILRSGGAQRGLVNVNFDAQTRITLLRAWCIPASGKDYEVKEKDAVESAVIGVDDSSLISDVRAKLMSIPAAIPGSIVGYEVEQEHRPYLIADEWDFQDTVPVREAHYSLQLPPGWTYQANWLNHPEIAPAPIAEGKWRWTVKDVKPVRIENSMPPWRGVAARLFLALTPPDKNAVSMQSWRDIGLWYTNLTRDRRVTAKKIQQQVNELTTPAPTQVQKMQALALFAQNNIRYVAIELGIGGYQPHAATETFKNRFGDCKDKVTLLSVMLKEIGIESYYVIINTQRGSVAATTPPTLAFNHAILAIALPNDVKDPTLLSQINHPKLGRLLFFDPTDTLTPLGRITGSLQSNYGLLVTPDGGELVKLPQLPVSTNVLERSAQFTLDEKGVLRGDIKEVWTGDFAARQRGRQRSTTRATDQIKPIESLAAASFASFQIVKASIVNQNAADKPFEWRYSLEAFDYAKVAGNLLLVRPRVLGSKSSGFLETKEPRTHPIEFDGPERHKDVFEIALPDGYEIDELPPPVAIDHGFASYESKSEKIGRTLRYTRVFEVKELSVPTDKAEKLKQFYRSINNDERNVAVVSRKL